MTLIDTSRDIRPQNLKGATLVGYVVDVNDPEKRQRVRVRVPVLHRGIPDSKLPWANQQGTGQANAGGGVGTAAVPDKYASVAFNLLEDDPHNPHYSATSATDDVNKDNELLQEDYPNTVGHVDSHGNRWSTNKATGDVTMVHKTGATITIDGSGNISIGSPGDVNIGAKGNLNLGAQGKINIHAAGTCDVVGSTIELNTGSGNAVNVPGARQTPQIPNRGNKETL